MIQSNINPENCPHSALQDFMTNVLKVQKHPQLSVVDDNVRSPPPSPKAKTRKAILQFTSEEIKSRWPMSPAPIKTNQCKHHRSWGDLHIAELQKRHEEPAQKRKEESDIQIKSNQRFKSSSDRFNDRPLPSSVIGGHVAMLRQNSLERHFLAKAEEQGEEELIKKPKKKKSPAKAFLLPTVPEEDEVSLNDDHHNMESHSPMRKKRRHHNRRKPNRGGNHHELGTDSTGCMSPLKPWKSDLLEDKLAKNNRIGMEKPSRRSSE